MIKERDENRPIRIADIAEELGVSTATVSNVIHGKTGKVSPETVRRVQETLEKRRYIPSMAGILLAQNDSRIIGVVMNDHEKYQGHLLEDPFIAASLNALAAEIDRRGLFMMVKATRDTASIIRFASMWNLEGMVLIGFCQEDYQLLRQYSAVFAVSDYYAVDLMQFLQSQGIAVPEQISVAGFDDTPICRQVVPALTSVRQDSALRARLALEKLEARKAGEECGSTLRLPVTLIKRDSTRSL